jgi:hypothetical protein
VPESDLEGLSDSLVPLSSSSVSILVRAAPTWGGNHAPAVRAPAAASGPGAAPPALPLSGGRGSISANDETMFEADGNEQPMQGLRQKLSGIIHRQQPTPAPARLEYSIADRPVLWVEAVEFEPSEVPWAVPEHICRSLEDLVRPAIAALTKATPAHEATYRLVFSEQAQQGLRDGTLTLAGSHAVARDHAGRIVEHATLGPASALDAVRLSNAVWGVMAFATQQRYLTVINQRLDQIHAGVEQLRRLHYHDQLGELLGSLDELRGIQSAGTTSLLSLDDRTSFRGTLDRARERSSAILRAAELELRDAHAKLNAAGASRRRPDPEKDIDPLAAAFADAAHVYLLAVQTQLAVAQLTRSLPVSQASLPQLQSRIDEELARLRELCAEAYAALGALLPDGTRRRRLASAIHTATSVTDWFGGLLSRPVSALARLAADRAVNAADQHRTAVAKRWYESFGRVNNLLTDAITAASDLARDLKRPEADQLLAIHVAWSGKSITSVALAPSSTEP